MANSRYSLTIRDYDKELSTFRVNSALLTAANIVAQEGFATALKSAVQGITLGIVQKDTLTAKETVYSNLPPSDPVAQRESKWLVRSEDNSTHVISRNEIPTADLTNLTGNQEYITDFSAGVLAAFKSAWEAFVVSEDGNPVTLISLQAVGKRL